MRNTRPRTTNGRAPLTAVVLLALVAVIAIGGLVLASGNNGLAAVQLATPTIEVDSPAAQVVDLVWNVTNPVIPAVGGTQVLEVSMVAGAQQVSSFALYIDYDPTIVTIANQTTALDQNNDLFPSVLQNTRNNATGRVNSAAGYLLDPSDPEAPPNPSGTQWLLRITFTAAACGTSPITFAFSTPDVRVTDLRLGAESVLRNTTNNTIQVCAAAGTNTPTPTATSTVAASATPSSTPTNTSVPPTNTPTNTPTLTTVPPTATPTNTPTLTTVPPTATPTNTPTLTTVPPTATPTNTATNTAVPGTNTPTPTPTATTLVINTNTPTPTATATVVISTNTPTPTATETLVVPSATPTATATGVVVSSATPTATETSVVPTATATATGTSAPAQTATPTPTLDPSITPTVTTVAPVSIPPTSTPVPAAFVQCDNLGARTGGTITAAGSQGIVTAAVELSSRLKSAQVVGNVFCRLINLAGSYITAPQEVGDLNVVQRGVKNAVDFFGLLPNGARGSFIYLRVMQVCFDTEYGDVLLFGDATTSPRIYYPLATFTSGDYICAYIGRDGTVVQLDE